ncbi:MAG TPA: hypothetical protein VIZ19_11205 [Roseiarcus sp.]
MFWGRRRWRQSNELLALGLMAAPRVEANAVVCAHGVYRAGMGVRR